MLDAAIRILAIKSPYLSFEKERGGEKRREKERERERERKKTLFLSFNLQWFFYHLCWTAAVKMKFPRNRTTRDNHQVMTRTDTHNSEVSSSRAATQRNNIFPDSLPISLSISLPSIFMLLALLQ